MFRAISLRPYVQYSVINLIIVVCSTSWCKHYILHVYLRTYVCTCMDYLCDFSVLALEATYLWVT